jgi:hypothetical protein
MPRGGHRENAGRKRATPNKATAARQAEVAASGITPLEVMLANMRFHHQQAEELIGLLSAAESPEAKIQLLGEIVRQRQIAQRCAADAANYVHPNLASIQHGEDPDHPLKSVTDADRLQVMLGVFRERGWSSGALTRAVLSGTTARMPPHRSQRYSIYRLHRRRTRHRLHELRG